MTKGRKNQIIRLLGISSFFSMAIPSRQGNGKEKPEHFLESQPRAGIFPA